MSVIAATLSAMVPLRNTWLMYLSSPDALASRLAVQFRTSSPKRRSALARSAATCVAFGVPCSLPPFLACQGVSSVSSKRTVPLPLRCGLAAGLGIVLHCSYTVLRLSRRIAQCSGSSVTVSMNAAQ